MGPYRHIAQHVYEPGSDMDNPLNLFESRLAEIERAFTLGDHVEFRRGGVVSHPRAES